MSFLSCEEMLAAARTQKISLAEAVLRSDLAESRLTEEQSRHTMRHLWHVMEATSREYDPAQRSRSGLSGGDAAKVEQAHKAGRSYGGDYLAEVTAEALKTAECNACMKRIVAAPTAGSCGVIPAVLISYEEVVAESEESGDDPAEDRMVQALFTAAGIGKVIAENASIAGASGGCQAEIGTAAAMAAGALTFLQGGTTRQIMQAAAFALKNMLGLTCDPVGGLVEVPCIKRNVAGVVNAISAAQLAMAGIVSAISPDDTIDSMRRIGNELPVCLKETGMGGLAVTESAKKIMKKMLNVTEMLKID